jgi:hypothetical protein
MGAGALSDKRVVADAACGVRTAAAALNAAPAVSVSFRSIPAYLQAHVTLDAV